ncbi:MAG: hypothetical protein ACJ0KI_04360 [Dehalococcoidia bacterium]
MNTRNVTGLTLIIAPIVVILSWIVWSMLDPDGPSASGTRANADILQPLMLGCISRTQFMEYRSI